jgi:hypothetical protein
MGRESAKKKRKEEELNNRGSRIGLKTTRGQVSRRDGGGRYSSATRPRMQEVRWAGKRGALVGREAVGKRLARCLLVGPCRAVEAFVVDLSLARFAQLVPTRPCMIFEGEDIL